MNRTQEQLIQRKIKKATEKNTKEKLLKSIYRRQKALAEKKQEIEKANIDPESNLKKKMDFYDAVIKGDYEDEETLNETQKSNNTGEQQGISKNSKAIKKESNSHPDPRNSKQQGNTDYKKTRIDRNAERLNKVEERKTRYHKMSRKTNRGQPVMKNLMNDLYHKVKQSYKN